jgi:hypothetical protein
MLLFPRSEENSVLHVGFTGSRYGMADTQAEWLDAFLEALRAGTGTILFRHGDCDGADDRADKIAASHACIITIHPPDNLRARANCHLKRDGARRVVLPRKPYLERNRDIVDRSKIMIATPKEAEMQQRGGTWSTVRYANKIDRPTAVIRPDGIAKLLNFPQE